MTYKTIPIAGDASFRKFDRLFINKKSKIVINAKKDKYKNLISYSAINQFLRKNNILAPKLFSLNYHKGEMIIEDFGDVSLYEILLKKNNKFNIYKNIIDLLLKIQKIKNKKKLKSFDNKFYIIKNYSKEILFKESNLFFDWYLPLFLSKKKISSIKIKSNKILLKLYNKLNFSDTCFVHRDYHVQNLMKVGKKIAVIDTQDALIGHRAYDLASLIDDVRIKTSTKLKNKIYKYYLKKSKKKKFDLDKFSEDFNILSVQRSLKIIGIFSRLHLRDKKNHYLKLIPYTWKLLEMRLGNKIFSELNFFFNTNIPKHFRKKINYK
jgi:aminoglycoside/choline kinase family phosphotransferase